MVKSVIVILPVLLYTVSEAFVCVLCVHYLYFYLFHPLFTYFSKLYSYSMRAQWNSKLIVQGDSFGTRKCEYLKDHSLDFEHEYMTAYLAS